MFLLHSNHQMEYVVHVQNRRNRLCKGAIAHPHIWVGKEAKPSPSNGFRLQLAPPSLPDFQIFLRPCHIAIALKQTPLAKLQIARLHLWLAM